MQWTAEGSIFGTVNLCFLCMKYLQNRWTDLHQIHKEDVFGPSPGQIWRSRSKVKGQGHQAQKTAFLALLVACVWFMLGTTLASSLILFLFIYLVTHYPPFCGTEWPIICWCAVKKLLTQSLFRSISEKEKRHENVTEQ